MRISTMLSKAISEELHRQGKAGLVVWYDEGGTLASVIETALPKGIHLLRYGDSYLALRFRLESEDPEFQKKWVIYIAERPHSESWLRDWELLGTRWQVDLLELLRQKAHLSVTPALIELLRKRPNNASDLVNAWDRLVGAKVVGEPILIEALLALGFGLPSWNMEHAVLALLGGGVGRKQLEARGLWEPWKDRVAEWTGWAEVPDDDAALRRKLEAAILLSEAAEAIPAILGSYSGLLPSAERRPIVAALAKSWRHSEEFRNSFISAAQTVEEKYGLINLLAANEELLSLETFPAVDEVWRREIIKAVAPEPSNLGDSARRIGQIAEQRSKTFWAKHGPARYWEPLSLAIKLRETRRKAMKELERLSHLDGLIEHYTSENGWWQLDMWALKLAAMSDSLSAEEKSHFADPAWRAYTEWLNTINARVAAIVEDHGWQPEATQFWKTFVSATSATAVLLVDAMRYDMAMLLANLLPKDEFDVELRALRGMLPSVTELGMAALLPGAEEGLDVGAKPPGFHVLLEGEIIGRRQERAAWLERRLERIVRIVELDKAEETVVDSDRFLVVLSREIDAFGTFTAGLYPQGLLEMVERIARTVRHLSREGFDHFTVVADHGFLFLPPGSKPYQLKAPVAKLCARRFAVGGTAEGCVTKRGAEIGLRGSGIFCFPTGLAVFGLPGELGAFVHGGLSLQECVVPVVQARVIKAAHRVPVVMELPVPLTSRIAMVTLRVKERIPRTRSRRVFVEINGKQSSVEELDPSRGEMTIPVRWLDFDASPPPEVVIRLFDAETQQLLQESKVTVSILA